MKITLAIFLSTIFILTSAQADQWSVRGQVDQLRVQDGDRTLGEIVGATLECGTDQFIFAQSIAKEDQVFSILLTAQTTGKEVEVWEIGCDNGIPGRTTISGANLIQ